MAKRAPVAVERTKYHTTRGLDRCQGRTVAGPQCCRASEPAKFYCRLHWSQGGPKGEK